MGYTLRRLIAKCVNAHLIKRGGDELQPVQVGVGVSGGAEAGDAPCDALSLTGQTVIKLDFSIAYNTVRRDTVLDTVADKIPELYRFIHTSLSGNPGPFQWFANFVMRSIQLWKKAHPGQCYAARMISTWTKQFRMLRVMYKE